MKKSAANVAKLKLGKTYPFLEHSFKRAVEGTLEGKKVNAAADRGPKQYLHARRLAGVRRELRLAPSEVRVVDVANRWGFWHMGRFAADYRKQFGEQPSETLRRRNS